MSIVHLTTSNVHRAVLSCDRILCSDKSNQSLSGTYINRTTPGIFVNTNVALHMTRTTQTIATDLLEEGIVYKMKTTAADLRGKSRADVGVLLRGTRTHCMVQEPHDFRYTGLTFERIWHSNHCCLLSFQMCSWSPCVTSVLDGLSRLIGSSTNVSERTKQCPRKYPSNTLYSVMDELGHILYVLTVPLVYIIYCNCLLNYTTCINSAGDVQTSGDIEAY